MKSVKFTLDKNSPIEPPDPNTLYRFNCEGPIIFTSATNFTMLMKLTALVHKKNDHSVISGIKNILNSDPQQINYQNSDLEYNDCLWTYGKKIHDQTC